MSDERVTFVLNGQKHEVPNTVYPATRLVDYIRQTALLKGTKVTCREGGCGVCVVTVQYKDHVTSTDKTRAINSCLCPLYLAHGWQITTTEGLGGQHDGFHPIQERMAEYSASQCGFCTPGFVMSMYGLLSENPSPSSDEVAQALDGNLCRCTGYRSIMDAMTSFAKDGKDAKLLDIEDIQNVACMKKKSCKKQPVANVPVIFKNWQRPSSLQHLYQAMDSNKEKNIRLVVGNTASGVYKKERFDLYFETTSIPDLYKIKESDDFLEFGANLSLTDLQEAFKKYKGKTGFGYLQKLATHIDVVGNTPIRNIGSWTGNLMIQHDHPEFVSDLLPSFEALGAKIMIGSSSSQTTVSPEELMSEDMTGKVILSIRFPALSHLEKFDVYKVMLRAQSAHAYVTAGFKIKFDDGNSINSASLVYGGLYTGKEFHAKKTEQFLVGKNLTNIEVRKECLKVLGGDMTLTDVGLSSIQYRTHLAQNLLFKCLSKFVDNDKIPTPSRFIRPPVSGHQDAETVPELHPITKPMPKTSAKIQTSGEAIFLDDIPIMEKELAGLLILSTIAKGNIESINTEAALAFPGVVDVLTAKDAPKTTPNDIVQLFASDTIGYNGQPIALVLAEDLATAYRAYGLVKVTYKNVETPIVDIDYAIAKESFHDVNIVEKQIGDVDETMQKCTKVIEGTIKHGSQYHFYLENQGCLVAPFEDGYEIYSSTQSTDWIQCEVAKVLGIPASRIKVTVPRVGGGFGGKLVFAGLLAQFAAIGAAKTHRPVRMALSLETCVKITAHRPAIRANYKVGVDKTGQVQAIDTTFYWCGGAQKSLLVDGMIIPTILTHSDGVYHIPNMRFKLSVVKTNLQVPTTMRSPGQLPAHLLAEQMMEQVAFELGEDPLAFKYKHLSRKGQMMMLGVEMPYDTTPLLWDELIISADVANRQTEIAKFNKENRWVKRGVAMTPGKFLVTYQPSFSYTAYMAVYHHDGSVHISHGGCEFGQGLDIKVAQVAMKHLDLPLEMIKVEPSNTVTAPNTIVTGGSMPSEYICRTVQECCKTILAKLAPIREKNHDADWKTLVEKAHEAGIHMAITERYISPTQQLLDYPTLGVCVAEAKVDILTGETQILRTDIHMDLGYSVNPTIDVGQIEGALAMGLGMMLTEQQVNSQEDGELLTANSWEYKIPTAADVPSEIRVSFLKGKPNENGVFSSRALGEPPMCTTPVFLYAVRAAVTASRRERGRTGFIELNAPATPERVLKACDVTADELIYEYVNTPL